MFKKRARRCLMVGVTGIVMLAWVSHSRYQTVILNAKEAVLIDNLTAMRDGIKQYIKDRQSVPQSLQDLVIAGYFRELPIDPITRSNSSWKPVVENVVISPGKTARGITDLHSGSSSTSSNGTIYGVW